MLRRLLDVRPEERRPTAACRGILVTARWPWGRSLSARSIRRPRTEGVQHGGGRDATPPPTSRDCAALW